MPQADETVQLPGDDGELADWRVKCTNPDSGEFWATHTNRLGEEYMRTFSLIELKTARIPNDELRRQSMPQGNISNILDGK